MQISINVDGNELNVSHHILSIIIQQRIDLVDRAEIIIKEEQQAGIPFSIFHSDQFNVDKILKISISYGEGNEAFFDGIIASQTISCDTIGHPILVLTCSGIHRVIYYPVNNPSSIPYISVPQLKLIYGANVIRFSFEVKTEPAADTLDWLCGYVEIHGSGDAKINTMVSLNGFGPRFSHDAYIAGVKHVVEDGNWISKLELGRTKTLS